VAADVTVDLATRVVSRWGRVDRADHLGHGHQGLGTAGLWPLDGHRDCPPLACGRSFWSHEWLDRAVAGDAYRAQEPGACRVGQRRDQTASAWTVPEPQSLAAHRILPRAGGGTRTCQDTARARQPAPYGTHRAVPPARYSRALANAHLSSWRRDSNLSRNGESPATGALRHPPRSSASAI
jgi:hypothetical protein